MSKRDVVYKLYLLVLPHISAIARLCKLLFTVSPQNHGLFRPVVLPGAISFSRSTIKKPINSFVQFVNNVPKIPRFVP